MNGVAADNPDFLIDLGDTFAMDNGSTTCGPWVIPQQPNRNTKITLPTFNIVSGSSPIFLCQATTSSRKPGT